MNSTTLTTLNQKIVLGRTYYLVISKINGSVNLTPVLLVDCYDDSFTFHLKLLNIFSGEIIKLQHKTDITQLDCTWELLDYDALTDKIRGNFSHN